MSASTNNSPRSGAVRRGPARGSAGFTLLEVLIAFAILAVMLVPILQVFGGGLGTTETARGYTTATLLARSKLAEAGRDAPLSEGITEGRFEQNGYRWKTSIVRDESEVIEPEAEAAAGKDPRRERTTSGSRRQGGGFGSGSGSSGFGSSGFSSGSSGFSSGSSGFSSGSSGFGSGSGLSGGRSSGFGQRSGLGGRSTTGDAGVAGDEDGDTIAIAADLIAYRVTVTVEWQDADSRGAVTLSSLRVGRSGEPPETEAEEE